MILWFWCLLSSTISKQYENVTNDTVKHKHINTDIFKWIQLRLIISQSFLNLDFNVQLKFQKFWWPIHSGYKEFDTYCYNLQSCDILGTSLSYTSYELAQIKYTASKTNIPEIPHCEPGFFPFSLCFVLKDKWNSICCLNA